MNENELAKMSLEALRHRLTLQSLRLAFIPVIGGEGLELSVGEAIGNRDITFPYDWKSAILYRTHTAGTDYITECVHFGSNGSASTLELVHKQPFEVILSDIIISHHKLHSALNEMKSDVMLQYRLDENERVVIYLAATGLSAKEAALEMNKKLRTVEYYQKTAKEKLGARTMTEAVYRAIRTRQM